MCGLTENKKLKGDIIMDGKKNELAMHKWISVKDRLPDEEGHYLCATVFSPFNISYGIYGLQRMPINMTNMILPNLRVKKCADSTTMIRNTGIVRKTLIVGYLFQNWNTRFSNCIPLKELTENKRIALRISYKIK